MLLTPREQSGSESSHLGGQCPPGIRLLGCRKLDEHQLAAGPSRCPELLTTRNGAGVRAHERSSKDPIKFSNKDHPPGPWNDISGSSVPLDGTPSLRSWPGATHRLGEIGRQGFLFSAQRP